MNSLGDIALGFSASAGDSDPTPTFPSVFYTARHDGDPPGQMTLGEGSIKDGTGSQTTAFHRWGDYTAMDIDPTDDTTFWYINEYVPTTSVSGWQLRIGAFNLAGGPSPTPTATASPSNIRSRVFSAMHEFLAFSRGPRRFRRRSSHAASCRAILDQLLRPGRLS